MTQTNRLALPSCWERFELILATKHPASGVIPFVMTTKLQVRGSWNEVKGKLKQKYSQLTDDDLSFAEGKEDELLGRLQRRLGKSKEDLRAEIEKL